MSEAPSAVGAPGTTLTPTDLPGGVAELWLGEHRLAPTCHIRDTWLGRAKGLLGRSGLGMGEVMFLTRCRSVHTLGMRFPIDVIYVSKDFKIVGLRARVSPWRSPRGFPRCRHVVEAAAGSIEAWGLLVGDRLEVRRATHEKD